MYCAQELQFACRCLPQRLKPQTAGRLSFFYTCCFSFSVFFKCFDFPCSRAPFFIGPKTSMFWVFWPYFFAVSFGIL